MRKTMNTRKNLQKNFHVVDTSSLFEMWHVKSFTFLAERKEETYIWRTVTHKLMEQ